MVNSREAMTWWLNLLVKPCKYIVFDVFSANGENRGTICITFSNNNHMENDVPNQCSCLYEYRSLSTK